jgi:hypothetical protein
VSRFAFKNEKPKNLFKATALASGTAMLTYYMVNIVREEFKLLAEESITAPLQPTVAQREQHKEMQARTHELLNPTKKGDKPRVVILGMHFQTKFTDI